MATKFVARSEVNASNGDFVFGSKGGPVSASFTARICVVWQILVLVQQHQILAVTYQD